MLSLSVSPSILARAALFKHFVPGISKASNCIASSAGAVIGQRRAVSFVDGGSSWSLNQQVIKGSHRLSTPRVQRRCISMAMKKSEYLSDVWKDGIFNNKVVFCTGGNGTICSAQVRAMVHLGANACIVGRNVEKTESMAKSLMTAREGSKVIGIGSIDVRSPESLDKAVETCVKELGGIDYCIAGAAGNFLSPLSHLSPNAFKSVLDIDVLGSYNTLKSVLPHLLLSAQSHPTSGPTGTGGRLIFISATIHYTGAPLQTHVAVAKAGVDALAANVAIEYGPRGLTSNVIAPGPIGGTEGMERLSRSEDAQASMKRVPLGRWGTVKEIADATVWLFSDAANYVNGETVVVDGGAWRTASVGTGTGFEYPDFLLGGGVVEGVKGSKKEKAKAKL